MDKTTFPSIEELERNEEGYCIPPEGVTSVSKIGAGHAKGHRGQVYPPGTFGENTTAFTSETAIEAIDKGREKKRLAVRTKMEEQYDMPLEDIIGDDVALFHKEIVRNADVSARSRIDTESFVIEQAGLSEQKGQPASSGASFKIEGITPELARQIYQLFLVLKGNDQPELPDIT